MARIMSIDYGTKRTGIAVSDVLQIIATGLTTVPTQDIFEFIEDYLQKEPVSCIVVGNPKKLDNTPSQNAQHVVGFVRKLQKKYPSLSIETLDERFTSVMSQQAMIAAGSTKKQRQNKETVDMISAVLLLQNFMDKKKMKIS
ncbi:MAG: Holliday junction resolvase RuvX [Bacteroidetes bacterium]|nr:Holliday junction resolvase RuvX [Bacteroidota bacterium]